MTNEAIHCTTQATDLHSISDDELLRRLGALARESRRVEADLVAHIGEVDERRLYARFAFPSMFAYCTEALHLTEAEAYRRITVARAAREHPMLLPMLRDGRLHVSGLALLVGRLTSANREDVLRRATHASRREIERLAAELAPRPDVRSLIRKLPDERAGRAAPTAGAAEACQPSEAVGARSQRPADSDARVALVAQGRMRNRGEDATYATPARAGLLPAAAGAPAAEVAGAPAAGTVGALAAGGAGASARQVYRRPPSSRCRQLATRFSSRPAPN
jgi:uncharacterized small protein (DUF1192 family)